MAGKLPSSLIVIPARIRSSRLPRKLLLRETGKTLLQHTYEAACTARLPTNVCVATDDIEIADEVRRFGGTAVMTNRDAPSGTDRVAEAVAGLPHADIIVNVQGDEPEIRGESIDLAIQQLANEPSAMMSTLATPIRDIEQLRDPACVKAVRSVDGAAIYFSRSPIPHLRDGIDETHFEEGTFLQHLGIYAYRRDFLLRLSKIPPSPLERLERLEQLRVLEAGYRIQIGLVSEASIGVDTPEDYRRFVASRAA